MGLGAGWHGGEHTTYGVDYPSLGERFDRLDEYIAVMKAMWGEGPASFDGRYYRLHEAQTLPKPAAGRPDGAHRGRGREAHPAPGGEVRARVEQRRPDARGVYRHKCELLAGYCDEIGRDPGEIRHTTMTMGLIGATDAELEAEASLQMLRRAPPDPISAADYIESLRGRGAIMGTPDQIVDKVGRLAESGIDEVVFIWFNLSSEPCAGVARERRCCRRWRSSSERRWLRLVDGALRCRARTSSWRLMRHWPSSRTMSST